MSLPPEAGSIPALQMIRWIRAPFALLEDCNERLGDAFTLRMPGMPTPIVLVSDPLAVKDLFALGQDEGHAGKANVVLKPFLGEHSLLLLDGAEHMRQRKMMLPAFHGERMHAYGRAMFELAHDVDRRVAGGTALLRARSDAGHHAAGDPAHGLRRRGPRAASWSSPTC